MKRVEFVRIKSEWYGTGPIKGGIYRFSEAEETIRKWIGYGWTYCGFVPIDTRGVGDIETMSLIFTKDEEPPEAVHDE